MSARLLIDTDVIIDGLRGYHKAEDYFQTSKDILLVSAVTVGELYAGMKGQHEQLIMEKFLHAFQIISLDATIAKMGGTFRCQYGKSHGTGLADAFIAATAMCIPASLVTLNTRHYPMVDALILPYRK